MPTPNIPETWSTLSAATSQVLICDLQEEIVARSKTTPPKALSQSAEVLCQIGELFSLPLTLSVVPEGDKAPKLIASLRGFATEQNRFLRANADPFIDTATREHLAGQNRKTLIIAGFATEVVVLHAALSALQQGYGVIVAVDACGGMSERSETAALTQIRESGGIIAAIVTIATKLSPDFTTAQGKRMFEIVQTLRLA